MKEAFSSRAEDNKNLDTVNGEELLVSEVDDDVYTEINGERIKLELVPDESSYKVEELSISPEEFKAASLEGEDIEQGAYATLDNEKNANENLDKQTYLELKRQFKIAESEYYSALDNDKSLLKVVGIGRNKLGDGAKTAYGKFMMANKAYLEFGNNSGIYDKINDRLNRDVAAGQDVSVNSLVADRHVLSPAEKRLEHQTLSIENEKYKNAKEWVLNKLKSNPRVAKNLGYVALGAGVAINAPGVLAGLLVNKIGKNFINKAEQNQQEKREDITDAFLLEKPDLELLESEYFSTVNNTYNTKVKSRLATTAAAIAAGKSFSNADIFDTVGDISDSVKESFNETFKKEDISELKQFLTPEVVSESSNFKFTNLEPHLVKSGDNLTSILSEAISKQVDAGNFNLPEGYNKNDVSKFLYQELPEFRASTEALSRFTPQDWIDMGVSSGNPQIIQPGETINLNQLLNKLNTPLEIGPGGLPEIPAVENYVIPKDELLPDFVSSDTVEIGPGGLPEIEPVPETELEPLSDYVPADEAFAEGGQSGEVLPDAVTKPQVESVQKYFNETHVFATRSESLRQHLAETLLTESKMGIFDLPPEVVTKLGENPDFMHVLVDRAFPELSKNEGFLNSIFGTKNNNTLLAEQWEKLGVKGGDPANLQLGSEVKVGEIKKMFLQKVAEDYSTKIVPSYIK